MTTDFARYELFYFASETFVTTYATTTFEIHFLKFNIFSDTFLP